jgi:uncharacterized protein YkwD
LIIRNSYGYKDEKFSSSICIVFTLHQFCSLRTGKRFAYANDELQQDKRCNTQYRYSYVHQPVSQVERLGGAANAGSCKYRSTAAQCRYGKRSFGHDGFDNRIADIRKSAGFIRGAAENVAYGQLTAAQVVDGWLNSPGHKKNIEGDYNLTGIGTVQREDGVIYFTQIFIKK